MLKHAELTHRRIVQFIRRELRPRVVPRHVPMQAQFAPGVFNDAAEALAKGAWQPIEAGFRWGPAYKRGWYRATGAVPKDWGGEVGLLYGEPNLETRQEGTFEGTVWRENAPAGGLDFGHPYFRLSEKPSPGSEVDLAIEVFAHNSETTVFEPEKPRRPDPEVFPGLSLASPDRELEQLCLDMEYGENLLRALPENNPAYGTLLKALNQVCNDFDAANRKTIGKCRKVLSGALENLGGGPNHRIFPVGHAHLDTAWLWPLDTTRFKMVHTTAVQLDLLERYPEHLFVHSQASQYEWLEKDHPKLFERVKSAIKKGGWEPLGSMWVEADCNLSGGESLVRQFLYGKKYFREKLGVETQDMWLPDVFGYAAALPQILDKFDIKYFLTQKLSWSQFNKIPHHTFWWQGIDGTKVWTHFPPADTYNGSSEPKEMLESVQKHRDDGRCDVSLYPFGFGDGGGGPTPEHLERLRRARQTSCLPEIEKRKKAVDFFESAYEASDDLMTWVGELYLEFHRGTYTSQAANKKGNRDSEFLLRDAEFLAAFAPDYPQTYPAEELEQVWKKVLLNQFHDIIPGSSVREVYEESARDYEDIRQRAQNVIDHALCSHVGRSPAKGEAHAYAFFQNASLAGEGSLPWRGAQKPKSIRFADETLPVQTVEAFGEKKLVFRVPEEALGSVAVGVLDEEEAVATDRLKASARKLENNELSVRFDSNGNITSVRSLDDQGAEFIRPGELANVFQLLDDKPTFWDAWETEIYAQETAESLLKADSVRLVEEGPVRVAIEVVRTFGKSRITQRISLGPTPGIRFDTEIDWREDRKMLKVAFPFNVNAQKATYEIQYGHLERNTHQNTSWDMAQFEVCAQKWADLSEGGQGVAMLNDGKYGHDTLGNTMRLTLLKSPKAPDPVADMGVHRFTYVVLPHFDPLAQSDVVAAAYALNSPLRAVGLQTAEPRPASVPPLAVDDRNVIIESVKKAENSNQIVVRLYECHNTRGRATLTCAKKIKKARLANLAEKELDKLDSDGHTVSIDFRPFEIMTLLLDV
jgi:alpha-mannosidase